MEKETIIIALVEAVILFYSYGSGYLGCYFKINFEKNFTMAALYILRREVLVTMGAYQCLWDTPEGFLKCMVTGVIGMAAFGAWGIIKFRKQQI